LAGYTIHNAKPYCPSVRDTAKKQPAYT